MRVSAKQVAVPVITCLSMLSALGVRNVFAADTKEEVKEEKVVLGPPPTDWGLKQSYYEDAQKVITYKHLTIKY